MAGERGYRVTKTYCKVVSGESIAARPEIQKLLEEVNAGLYAGVLVVDLERLARGNSADQAYRPGIQFRHQDSRPLPRSRPQR